MHRVQLDASHASHWRELALPLPAASAGGDFAALLRQTRQEVESYIRDGAPDSSAPAVLSPEAAWARQRLADSAAVGSAASGTRRDDFLAAIAPHAAAAGRRLGVAADIIAAHAALESGWGQRPLTRQDGSDSHNLFGIKAGGSWQGEVLTALTTEHDNGSDVRRNERFRAYPDLAAAFHDYASLIAANPRLRAAVGSGNDAQAYARALAAGGYATDPAYASKLLAVVDGLRR